MDSPEQQPESKPAGAPLSRVHPALVIGLTLLIVFVAYQFIGGAILIAVFGMDFSPESIKGADMSLMRIVMSFSQFMFILFPALLLNMMQGRKIKETFRLKAPKLSIFGLSVLGILLVQPCLQAYLFFQNKLLFSLPFSEEIIQPIKQIFDQLENTTKVLIDANSIPEFLLVVFIIAVTPAICEEFLFRGLVFKNFEKFLTPFKGILYTGLIFAFFHFHPFNIVPLAILGFFLTFITYYSGSIYPAVICHFINNFLAAWSFYVFGNESFDDTQLQGNELMYYAIFGALSAVIFILILRFIPKLSDVNKVQEIKPDVTVQ